MFRYCRYCKPLEKSLKNGWLRKGFEQQFHAMTFYGTSEAANLNSQRKAFLVLLDHHSAKCLQRKVKGEVTAIWSISALDHTILRKCN